jgi:hypothetical protein
MSQHYSDAARESDTYSLPDVETFQAKYGDCPFCTSTVIEDSFGGFHCDACRDGSKGQGVVPAEILTGWFYWFCFPGCMPDSDPIGPFETEQLAIDDARESAE